MPRPIPLAVRHTIITLRESGTSQTSIATQTKVSLSTVKTILRRYRDRGKDGLKCDYNRCGPPEIRFDNLVYRQYVCLRKWHPGWGYDKITSLMIAKYGDRKHPDRRTVYRWWRKAGLVLPKSQPPKIKGSWAQQLHQTWQIDAKEKMKTQAEGLHCWLNVVDEYSGMVVDPPVFSPRENISGSPRADKKTND